MIAYRSLGTWRADGPFGAWLARIAVRLAVRRAIPASQVVWLDPLAADADLPGPRALPHRGRVDAADPSHSVLRTERDAMLRQAVASLDEPYREVVALRFFAERSLAEIAQATDRPLGTVKTHLHRGLARLRRAIDEADRMTGPMPRGGRFTPAEIDDAAGIRPDDLAAETRVARELEAIAAAVTFAPTASFADGVMAAIAAEPSPVPARGRCTGDPASVPRGTAPRDPRRVARHHRQRLPGGHPGPGVRARAGRGVARAGLRRGNGGRARGVRQPGVPGTEPLHRPAGAGRRRRRSCRSSPSSPRRARARTIPLRRQSRASRRRPRRRSPPGPGRQRRRPQRRSAQDRTTVPAPAPDRTTGSGSGSDDSRDAADNEFGRRAGRHDDPEADRDARARRDARACRRRRLGPC